MGGGTELARRAGVRREIEVVEKSGRRKNGRVHSICRLHKLLPGERWKESGMRSPSSLRLRPAHHLLSATNPTLLLHEFSMDVFYPCYCSQPLNVRSGQNNLPTSTDVARRKPWYSVSPPKLKQQSACSAFGKVAHAFQTGRPSFHQPSYSGAKYYPIGPDVAFILSGLSRSPSHCGNPGALAPSRRLEVISD